jgi:EAL domain-containing protein (putative c-di-GMP-specific phosphodiesterase class I)
MTDPIEFIPIAEETGLIAPLTSMVLVEGCRQVAEWQRAFGQPLTLSVNISTRLFDRPTLVDEVRDAITSTGLLPGTLRLEITESFLVNGTEQVIARLDELRSIPVELYLDDFGTGFSSLSYLHRYRLDALKIDRSFISRIGELHNDAPIVASIVSLAKELGMGVIAEGVETHLQAERLIALECPHAQGFLFSPPLSVKDAHAFLARQRARSLGARHRVADVRSAPVVDPHTQH